MTKKFISAGAGSGKTYTITTDVAKMVKDHLLNPDQVIMTTFTKAAAQELREKAKKELANLGLHREAQQMEHALIGTVHSVANTFLTKYWYLLGIMPDVAAMEESEKQMYRDHSLRGLLNKDDRTFLYHYAETYNVSYDLSEHKSGVNYEFWKKDLGQVLDYIQWYSIDDAQLQKSIDTTESFITCLDEAKDDKSLMEQAKAVINDIEDALNNLKRQTDKSNNERLIIDSYKNRPLTADELANLESIAKGRCKESENYKRFSASLAASTLFTKESADDQRKYAALIFRLASNWQKEYRQYKDEHHLIDFNDMEEMFLKLLNMEEVQQDIQSRYTHLYVDEFQDSNPMQVRIFQKLSSLLNTVYVGDKKQAIYGFRGSDTQLTTAVADSISDTEHLEHSYRSIEPLVRFSNRIFSQVFNNMKTEEVELKMPEKNGNTTSVEKPLRLWPYNGDKELALQIQQLILRESIAPKDIAVLARANDNLDSLADELRVLHVPVCRESNDIKESRAGRLMKSLLTLVNTPFNQLARAEVAYLTEPGYNITEIIENRLDHLANEVKPHDYLKDIPILKRLFQLRHFFSNDNQKIPTNLLGYQSISSLVESLVIELDLYSLVQSWDNALAEETNLQVLIDLAKKYEESSTKLAQPATITGFIDFFTNQQQEGAANDEGVRLYTYHKSKGLEWKVVIMLSLDNDASDATKIATRSMLGCHHHREQQPTAENPNPPMTISLVRNIYATTNDNATKAAVTARLQQHPLWEAVSNQEIAENARLLYVGVTRAREILILAPREKNNAVNLSWFRSVGVKDIKQLLDGGENQDLLGIDMPIHIERIDTQHLLEQPEEPVNSVHAISANFSSLDTPLYISPSKVDKTPHEIKVINDKECRMEVNSRKEDALMGDFIHQVFCCCDDGISVDQIVELRNSYGFTDKNMPEPAKLLDSWKYLIDTLESRYGKAIKRHHERPFRHFDADGHMVSGYIDFIWETEGAYVIVDYKTCPGAYNLVFNPCSEHYAGSHGNQLDCYQRALEAEGKKKVAARIIYYPVTQFVVEVK
ncbi:MAG: UvrD-helicase domain-containing protein [Bacteroidaceae bacterium]|nr:UvrD-helicase domain-containing protein [Bacteroidaceae bacterium]